MELDLKKIGIVFGVVVLVLALGYFIYRAFQGSAPSGAAGIPSFGTTTGAVSQVPLGQGGVSAGALPVFTSAGAGAQLPAVFKIADGPVVGAMIIETSRPTTTVARYVTGGDGHVLDMPLDVPGSVALPVSNTTIPGVEEAVWTESGRGVIVEYMSDGAVKSAHISLPPVAAQATSSAAAPAVRFLVDNILSLAASPDGKSVAYLVRNAEGGADGYLANPDGGNPKKLFSLPLSQFILSWPTAANLFAYTASAASVPGVALKINARTGAATPTLYGQGLTALEDPTGAYALYRTDDGTNASAFMMTLSTGATFVVSYPPSLSAPLPEQCAWGAPHGKNGARAYCAAAAGGLPSGFLDYWHRGQASLPNIIAYIDRATNTLVPIATPGTRDGGETSDITNISVSPDDRYLSFISKDDGVLWGVRLSPAP